MALFPVSSTHYCDPTQALDTEIFCSNCFAQFPKLKKCGRCRSVYYCGKECQKESYSDHKEYCMEYKQLYDAMKKEEKTLRDENYFAPKNIGHFWSLLDPRNYCRARYALAQHILYKAHVEDQEYLYEEGLKHFMELLRLCHSDNIGVRYEVAFILLNLNRDQDAYDFIKWWMTIDENGIYDWGQVPQNTKEGDWLYLKNENIHENLLQIIQDTNYIDLHWLSALTLIKMRILCKYNLLKSQMHSVRTLTAKWSNNIHNIIQEYLIGNHIKNEKCVHELIAKEKDCVDQYLSQMIQDNEVFVKALVNPAPLRKQQYPQYHSRGSNEHAYIVINKCCRLFARVEGILKMIETKVGSNPEYDPTFKGTF